MILSHTKNDLDVVFTRAEAVDAAAMKASEQSQGSLNVRGDPDVEFGLHAVCRLALITNMEGADICNACGICPVPQPPPGEADEAADP